MGNYIGSQRQPDNLIQPTQPTQPTQPIESVQYVPATINETTRINMTPPINAVVHTAVPVNSPNSIVNTIITKKSSYVHPFIDMITRNCSEAEMINTLQAFCGRIEVGTDSNNRLIYEAVDQTEFIGPVLQVFSYCANNGKKSVVEWLTKNFVPLQVSYDNNYCYFECLRWGHHDIADIIVMHESFCPDMQVLENLLSKNKYAHFKHCMASPYHRNDLYTYRFTFMHYVDTNEYAKIINLLQKIKQRLAGQTVEISDKIYPNPRFVKISVDESANLFLPPNNEPINITANEPLVQPAVMISHIASQSMEESCCYLSSSDIIVVSDNSEFNAYNIMSDHRSNFSAF